MKFIIHYLTEEYAKQLCTWRYQGEYSVYDFPSWDIAVQQNQGITNSKIREADFRSVVDEKGNFIGFFRMSEDEAGKIEIGLGLKPEYCGSGFGKDFVKVITQYALTQRPNCLIYMEVRTFNARAVKCYQACGYSIALKHHRVLPWGDDDYFRMEYQSNC